MSKLTEMKLIGKNEIHKAAFKATRKEPAAPKEKHLRRLLIATYDAKANMEDIVTPLVKRLEAKSWMVVLKSLSVMHKLFREGDQRFIRCMTTTDAFRIAKFKDLSNAQAKAQSLFVRHYARYLFIKSKIYAKYKKEFERNPEDFKVLEQTSILKRVPAVQQQFDALLYFKKLIDLLNNPISTFAFSMLLKDSFNLYNALNIGILTVLENYSTLEKKQLEALIEIYKKFITQTNETIQFFDLCKKFSSSALPVLQPAPTSMLEALEEQLRGEKTDKIDYLGDSKEEEFSAEEDYSSKGKEEIGDSVPAAAPMLFAENYAAPTITMMPSPTPTPASHSTPYFPQTMEFGDFPAAQPTLHPTAAGPPPVVQTNFSMQASVPAAEKGSASPYQQKKDAILNLQSQLVSHKASNPWHVQTATGSNPFATPTEAPAPTATTTTTTMVWLPYS